jgi:hypothetical protein
LDLVASQDEQSYLTSHAPSKVPLSEFGWEKEDLPSFGFWLVLHPKSTMSPDSDKPPSQNQQQQDSDQQLQTGSAQDSKKKRNGPKRRKVSHGLYITIKLDLALLNIVLKLLVL